MEMDAAFANLFGTQGEAAVLACDELGLVPRDVMHRPKKSFEGQNDSTAAVLVRYTLTERARQNNIRKILAVKNRLIVEGGVHEKWKARCKQFPDAPGVPKVPKALLEKALAELDTESSDDDGIDERGLKRPQPQYGVDGKNDGIADGNELTVGPTGGPSVARELSVDSTPRPSVASTTAPHPLTPARPPGVIIATRTEAATSASKQRKRRHQHKRYVKKYLQNHSINSASPAADGSSDLNVSSDEDVEVVPRYPKPPPDPPYLPPVPYPQRSTATLKKELEELDEYRLFLLRYAHDSAAMAEEYNNFTTMLKQEQKEREERDEVEPSVTIPFNKLNDRPESENNPSPDIEKNSDKPQKTPREKVVLPMTPHERQLAAYVRLAKLEVRRNRTNFKKWNGFLEEMEGIEPTGTIAADLRARCNINVFPTFEEYVQSVRDRAHRRERRLYQEQKAQKKLGAFCEAKDRRTEKNMEKLKNEHNDLYVEARLVQREIMKKNQEHENRRQDMRQQRYRMQLAKKEKHAEEYHKNLILSAKNKRFEHDHEEMLRQSLKNRVQEMDMRKKWDLKSVTY
ncbi:uncharacterized protein TM35_000172310 [Trypanosoma theileri]|uniref:Uncharacterized protein n=1 Tax=Trypanosoma theileri TaxID=67003 RepID=A0A1X0NVX5_9TRYP|nr:uncharacterized protein TM35_000172310 [Trypanosoma theileri]ORC88359.1 hypothetical protein TM35_000172310 [Trypanosoma theileri]